MPVSKLPAVEQLPAAPLVIGAYAFVWVALLVYVLVLWRRLGSVERELAALRRSIDGAPVGVRGDTRMQEMGAGHFIFIPAVLLVGVVIGWILGSRAARDAFAAELRRREKKTRTDASVSLVRPTVPSARRFASMSGRPARTIFACARAIG